MGSYFLTSFEVRSIQKYIYASNKVKLISGASYVVRDHLLEVLKEIAEEIRKEQSEIKVSFDSKDLFSFDIQLAYEGGGNLQCVIKGKELVEQFCKRVNAKFIKDTRSLSMAYAYVEIDSSFTGESFEKARNALSMKMSEVKKTMPRCNPQGALPITFNDSLTGLPTSQKDENGNHITYDDWFKLQNYEKYSKKDKDKDSILDWEELRDKGNDSFLAVVHIDGNNFGAQIKNYFKGKNAKDFSDAIRIERDISKSIKENFNNLITEVFQESPDVKYRIIINSGDDITFVIRGIYAIDIVTQFLRRVQKRYLGNDVTNTFSACAGIAFFKSHFPFSKAYKIAEECCENAKKLSKDKEIVAANNNKVPCSFDYYMIQNGILFDLETSQKPFAHLFNKPYFVYTDDDSRVRDQNSVDSLIEKISFLTNPKNIARNAAKRIRNIYEQKENDAKIEFAMINSRLKTENKLQDPFDERYYDASCLMDIYTPIFAKAKEDR